MAQEVASSVHFDAVNQAGIALYEAPGAAASLQLQGHDLAGILLERKPPYLGCAAARSEHGSQKQDGPSEHSGKVMYLRPMNIISWNVNGLRAVAGKGLHEIVRGLNPDVMGFLEIKCTVDQAKEVLDGLGYHVVAHEADKKGYSGTAIISKIKPISVSYGMGVEEHEGEGRVITAEFQDLYVVTTYVPNSKGDLSRIPQWRFKRGTPTH